MSLQNRIYSTASFSINHSVLYLPHPLSSSPRMSHYAPLSHTPFDSHFCRSRPSYFPQKPQVQSVHIIQVAPVYIQASDL